MENNVYIECDQSMLTVNKGKEVAIFEGLARLNHLHDLFVDAHRLRNGTRRM